MTNDLWEMVRLQGKSKKGGIGKGNVREWRGRWKKRGRKKRKGKETK